VGPRTERYDVAFVGRVYRNHPRERILSLLKEKFKNIHIGSERLYDLGEVYRSSKMVVNVSLNRDLNNRVFEAMAAGSLLLTDRIGDQLTELFKENVHLVCFDTPSELAERIEFFRENEVARARIAQSGKDEVLAKHTSLQRATRVLEVVLSAK